MIYITGDIHGAIDIGKLSAKRWKEQKNLTREDFLVVTGDFGFPFSPSALRKGGDGNKEYRYWLNWLKNKSFTILFVDGNHDNHDFWDSQPVREWHGGKVHIHPEADNIIHLMRGEVYTIDGKTIFAFGGAASHDIEPFYDDFGKCIWSGRTEGIDYWKREIASEEEMQRARENLYKNGNRVDIILTHTPPMRVVMGLEDDVREDPTAEFLNEIYEDIQYGSWFCGHLHCDLYEAETGITIVYDTVASLESLKEDARNSYENYGSEISSMRINALIEAEESGVEYYV